MQHVQTHLPSLLICSIGCFQQTLQNGTTEWSVFRLSLRTGKYDVLEQCILVQSIRPRARVIRKAEVRVHHHFVTQQFCCFARHGRKGLSPLSERLRRAASGLRLAGGRICLHEARPALWRSPLRGTARCGGVALCKRLHRRARLRGWQGGTSVGHFAEPAQREWVCRGRWQPRYVERCPPD